MGNQCGQWAACFQLNCFMTKKKKLFACEKYVQCPFVTKQWHNTHDQIKSSRSHGGERRTNDKWTNLWLSSVSTQSLASPAQASRRCASGSVLRCPSSCPCHQRRSRNLADRSAQVFSSQLLSGPPFPQNSCTRRKREGQNVVRRMWWMGWLKLGRRQRQRICVCRTACFKSWLFMVAWMHCAVTVRPNVNCIACLFINSVIKA